MHCVAYESSATHAQHVTANAENTLWLVTHYWHAIHVKRHLRELWPLLEFANLVGDR